MRFLHVKAKTFYAMYCFMQDMFWKNLTQDERNGAVAMHDRLEDFLAQREDNRKQVCKDLLAVASDDNLRKLTLPAKFAFMKIMKDAGPVDDEEYRLWVRMYACHDVPDMESFFMPELRNSILQFTATAEYANMQVYWGRMSDEERFSCLHPVMQGICENFGVPVVGFGMIDNVNPTQSGFYNTNRRHIMLNLKGKRFVTLRGAMFATIHETIHAVQDYMINSKTHLPSELQQMADIFFWNKSFYIPSRRVGKIYRMQPLEKQANGVANMMLMLLSETGDLPPLLRYVKKSPAQKPKPPAPV